MLNDLPEPLSVDDWTELYQEIRVSGSIISFADICELARHSPALNLAFGEKWGWGLNQETVKHFLAQDIERCHGLKLSFLEEGEIDEPDPYQILKRAIIAAEESSVEFDALLIACGRILDAKVDLHPQLQCWLVNYLLQRVVPPPARRGPDPFPNRERDRYIIHFLKYIDELKYPITENEASFENLSACHAIHEIFSNHLEIPSVKRLMNIWSERRSQR